MDPAGIYVRISSDTLGEGLGVARQEQDCRTLAAQQGRPVAEVYVDNDLSAFSGKPRPGYLQMLDDVRSGRIGAVIAWHTDRLHRSPKELEAFIDLVEATGCAVQTVQSGVVDLGTPSGRMVARQLGAVARYESEHKSARVRRKLEQNAAEGISHGGSRPYGWQADRRTLDPTEAGWVRLAAEMLLAGHSIKAIVRHLNAAGSVNSLGQPWRDVTVRDMLARPRNAGHRIHHGKVVGPGQWEPILPVEQWEQVRLVLTDPARRTTPGAAGRVHLLSGIATCGPCGALVRVNRSKPHKGVSHPIYRCTVRHCVSRGQEVVDRYVTAYVTTLLASPDAAGLLVPDDDSAAVERRAGLERLRTRLAVADAAFADGDIDQEQWLSIVRRVRPQIQAAEQAEPIPRPAVLDGLAGQHDAAARFDALDPSVQRAIVAALVTVTILPARRGPGFDPATVDVQPLAAVAARLAAVPD